MKNNNIYIMIFENQNANSTETNYFEKGLLKQFKKEKYNKIFEYFNNNIDNIYIDIINNIKIGDIKGDICLFKPSYIYGILDNDDKCKLDCVKSNFDKIIDGIEIPKENKKLLLPPNGLSFEYFLALHIFNRNDVILNKDSINKKLIYKFNVKNISDIKSKQNIFYDLFKIANGTNLLFSNVNKHPICDAIIKDECHNYKQFVEVLFQKYTIST